jgi:hypothetical protein
MIKWRDKRAGFAWKIKIYIEAVPKLQFWVRQALHVQQPLKNAVLQG